MVRTLLIGLLLLAPQAFAGENPTVQYKTGYGFMFLMPDGEQRFCGLVSETQVRCINKDQRVWACEYRDAPEYFTNCAIVE